MKLNQLIIIGCIVFLLLGGFAFHQSSGMHITTTPDHAEIWLDGENIGISPMKINIPDFKQHLLELKLDHAGTVIYDFNRFTMMRYLDIKSGYFRSSVQSHTANKTWRVDTGYDGVYLVNQNDPDQRKPIIEHNVSEDALIALAPPVWTSVSPDGQYAIMVSWIKGSTNAQPAFWLVPVGEPDKKVEVFSEYKDEINDSVITRMLEMGFSPDSKWIWITTNSWFAIASIDDPINPVLTFTDHIFQWSENGQLFAISEYSENTSPTRVYENVNGKWKLIAENIFGRPKGFSNDGRYLWTFFWYRPPEAFQKGIYGPVRLIDLQTDEVVSEITTVNNIWSMSTPVESLQGGRYAFVYREAFTQNHAEMLELGQDPNKGNLMIVNQAGIPQLTLYDDEYESVAYWFPDGKHLAVYVHGDVGYVMKIVYIEK